MNKKLNICFIGNGKHARRIQKVISAIGAKYHIIDFDRTIMLSEQDDVLRSHAIFITSPNDTHAQYLSILGDRYGGYIYCEKPPINQTEDIRIFDLIDSKRCFFGFNLRYSEIHEYLSVFNNKYKLGKLINMHIHQSYPFAMRPEYPDSWKSNRARSPYGVIENLGIHHIDMAISISGEIINIYKSKSNTANKGEAPDSAFICCEHTNSSVSNIFVSYATSFREEMYFTFEKGDIRYDGDEIKVYTPRASFDSKGLSIRPPIQEARKLDSESLYKDSLKCCIEEFVIVAQDEGTFSRDLFKHSKEAAVAMLN